MYSSTVRVPCPTERGLAIIFFTYMLQRHAHLFACGMQEQLLD